MGIRNLNTFICNYAKNAIRTCTMQQLSGKPIVVDASIYMYKYAANDTLMQNMYFMLHAFHVHKIRPLFVFDGKPPPEKINTIQKRKLEKQQALAEYAQLLQSNEQVSNTIRRKIATVSQEDVKQVKQLIYDFGMSYCNALGEADELCAKLVLSGNAWACMSDDTDMFAYGCVRVLRNFATNTMECTLYDLPKILHTLDLSLSHFRDICVLSGTDYAEKTMDIEFEELVALHKQFRSKAINEVAIGTNEVAIGQNEVGQNEVAQNEVGKPHIVEFSEWLRTEMEMNDLPSIEQLQFIQSKYELNLNEEILSEPLVSGTYNIANWKKILQTDGFLFLTN